MTLTLTLTLSRTLILTHTCQLHLWSGMNALQIHFMDSLYSLCVCCVHARARACLHTYAVRVHRYVHLHTLVSVHLLTLVCAWAYACMCVHMLVCEYICAVQLHMFVCVLCLPVCTGVCRWNHLLIYPHERPMCVKCTSYEISPKLV